MEKSLTSGLYPLLGKSDKTKFNPYETLAVEKNRCYWNQYKASCHDAREAILKRASHDVMTGKENLTFDEIERDFISQSKAWRVSTPPPLKTRKRITHLQPLFRPPR